MGLGITGHEKPRKGETVIWLTPPEILNELGPFDLDPCAAPSPRPWSTAQRHIELPENGLRSAWNGRVWLNPPYDETLGDWMRLIGEHGSGMALIFARTETQIWQDLIWPVAHSVFFVRGRIQFRRPDGSSGIHTTAPSALVSYSEFDTYILRRCGLRGSLPRRA